MTLKLYHCKEARSMRPLWTLEEMGLDYELVQMKFPPRFLHDGYMDVNPIGTVPAFTDSDVPGMVMTESAGICQYLVDRHGPSDLGLAVDHPEYGDYLNWLHRSDATLTFPQTIRLRYTQLEPEERRLPQAAEDYTQWFFSRLKSVERALETREFLVANRFTIADIAVGYALHLATTLDLREGFKPNCERYYQMLSERPAFQRAKDL